MASVLLQKPRSQIEVYNDLYGEVVNLFRVVRDRGEDLKKVLEATPFARDEYVLSHDFTDDPVENARRFVVRIQQGRGSGSGYKKRGFDAFHHQNGHHVRSWRKHSEVIPSITERMKDVIIENRPAIEVISQQDRPETLFYVDPPYLLNERTREKVYAVEMSEDDHHELALALNKIKGMAIVSGYSSSLYDEELYYNWRRVERQHLAGGAAKRTEVLWLSPNTPEVQLSLDFGI